MIKSPRDKFAVDNPPLIRIAFREMVINAERDERGFVHLSTCAEEQDASAFGRIMQWLANLLYRLGDAVHPLRYQGRLRVSQQVALLNRLKDKQTFKTTYRCLVNRLPVRLAHGHTSYQRFVLYKSFEDWQRAPLADVDVGFVKMVPESFFDLGEVVHPSALDNRHGVPEKK